MLPYNHRKDLNIQSTLYIKAKSSRHCSDPARDIWWTVNVLSVMFLESKFICHMTPLWAYYLKVMNYIWR